MKYLDRNTIQTNVQYRKVPFNLFAEAGRRQSKEKVYHLGVPR